MSTYPQIVAGMALTSALLQAMLPQEVRKPSDQSIASNNTVLVNDTALVLPLAASATYKFELIVLYKGNTAGSGDLQLGWTVPSGCAIAAVTGGVNASLGAVWGFMTATTVNPSIFGTNGTASPLGLVVSGTAVTSTSGGNMQLQWMQGHSNATATTVMAGSSLIARRIA